MSQRFLISIWLWFALLAATVDTLGAADSLPATNAFRAGASVIDISPTKYPVIVNAMFTERSATRTADPLSARALVLQDGTTRVALAVVDTCMMPRDLIDRAKALAHTATAIPVERMLISATHTHSAPSAMGCLGSRADPEYVAFLIPKIAEAIIKANSQLEPARAGWAVVDDWDHTFNRRWIRRPDRKLNDPFGHSTVRAHMHPGYESPDVVGPSGPVDPSLSLLAVQSRDGRPLALLANYSQHYYGSPLLSSDYYGRFAHHLSELLGATNRSQPFVAMMSQGTSGDLMWMDYGAPPNEIGYDAYAKAIAGRAFDAYQRIQFHDSVPLRMAQRTLELGYRVPDQDRLLWARKIATALGDRLPQSQPEIYAKEALFLHERPRTELVLQALRVGQLGITAIPNEVYALTGLKLKAQSPLQPTFNIELANGAEGYIPPPEQHQLGGYTTWPARTAGLEPEAEPKIVDALLGLLEEVSGKTRRKTEPTPGPYGEAVLAAHPKAYWRLDEMVVPIARDSSDSRNNATYESGVALYLPGAGSGDGRSPKPQLTSSRFAGSGEINRAAHFAGGRLKADLIRLGAVYTTEFWFWNGLTNTVRPVTGYLFSRGKDGEPSASGDHLGIGGTAQADFTGRLFFFNGNERNTVLVGRTPIAWRSWHHVALVRDHQKVTVYLNGKVEPEISGEAVSDLSADLATLFFGGRNDNFANFEGKMDEIAIYERALPASEVAAHFLAAALPAAPGTEKLATSLPLASPPLSPQESLAQIRVAKNYKVELAAAEPLVLDPVALDWDLTGRLWVAEMADYPLGLDGQGSPGGRIRVLEDTNADGIFDRSHLFAQGLRYPNGIMTWRDGVLVTAAPELLFLKDTNGDGQADVRQVLLSGFLEGNQQLRVNGLRWGLDNWVYCAAGGHHRGHGTGTRIKSARAGIEIALGSRDFRFRPDTGELDPQSGPAQFGRDRDEAGHWFGTQNSNPLWHYVLADHYLRRNPHIAAPDPVRQLLVPRSPKVYPASPQEKRFHSFNEAGHFTSACSGMIYRDDLLFARDASTHAFVCEPFHNLVHHAVLADDGVSFSARRAPGEETSEFFASADRWCRPVMVRTGPDGALWVVDMYRYMIEHPDWLPENGKTELLPHYRAGDDRGRIYRVAPITSTARPFRRLDTLSISQLVAALDSSNGWQRDKVQQLLLWRNDAAAVSPLQTLARSSSNALARLHALCTLDGLNALDFTLVIEALRDPEAKVRENALRLAETRPHPAVISAVSKLVDDPDPKVQLQLASTLGEWPDAAAGQALATLAVRHAPDPFLTAAVMSSALPHLDSLITAWAAAAESTQLLLTEPLLDLALAVTNRAAIQRLLASFVIPAEKGYRVGQLEGFGRFLETLARRKLSLVSLTNATSTDGLTQLLATRAAGIFEFARATASDSDQPYSARLAAAALLGRSTEHRSTALKILEGCLTPQVPATTQHAAVRALAATGDSAVPAILVGRWEAFSPETRMVALDALSSRSAWSLELLQFIADGRVAPQALDATRRARLLDHGTLQVKKLAQSLLGSSAASDRKTVVEQFQPALAHRGEAARGAAIYERLCLNCHQRDGRGLEVGPNLLSVAEHPPEKLLANIINPNADVQPGFHAYSCALSNGEELYGLIQAETANSLLFKVADGSVRTILRKDILSLRGSTLSLMPEGLETGLTAEDLANLIAFLRTPGTPLPQH